MRHHQGPSKQTPMTGARSQSSSGIACMWFWKSAFENYLSPRNLLEVVVIVQNGLPPMPQAVANLQDLKLSFCVGKAQKLMRYLWLELPGSIQHKGREPEKPFSDLASYPYPLAFDIILKSKSQYCFLNCVTFPVFSKTIWQRFLSFWHCDFTVSSTDMLTCLQD